MLQITSGRDQLHRSVDSSRARLLCDPAALTSPTIFDLPKLIGVTKSLGPLVPRVMANSKNQRLIGTMYNKLNLTIPTSNYPYLTLTPSKLTMNYIQPNNI